MLSAVAFYSILLYLVNVVSQLEKPSEVGDISDHFKPVHEFLVERQKFIKKTSKPKVHVSLIIGPYIFKQRKKAKGIGYSATFTCNGCEKLKTFVKASALKNADNDDANDFELSAWPSSNDHECVPSPVLPLKQKFIDTMYSRVKENPTQSIGSLYKDVRREFSKNLS